jgi:iron complex transport system ATP-binding protein
MLQAIDLTYAYYQEPVVAGVSLDLAPGDMTAIIGPNGSGKTTLLRLLSGMLRPGRGQVRLEGRTLASHGRKEIAQRLATVPQELSIPFPFTTRELVEMGRTPHLTHGWWNGSDPAGRRAVDEALGATGMAALARRPVNELSGGERQRAIIALALAQRPRYLLLDEPTTHLDIQHQIEVLELLARLNRERQIAVLATIHDLNLAALYFRRLILLDQGRIASAGTPQEVLTEERLRQVFHAAVRVTPDPVTRLPHVMLLRDS